MKLEITNTELTLINNALSNYKDNVIGGNQTQIKIIESIFTKIESVTKPKTPRPIRNKQYMFTFEGGGWNTVWAKTKKGAIKVALKEYKDSDSLKVNVKSLHLATEKGLESAMGLFY
ncbi:hypothetical protein N9P74_00235 [bacterium]|jgi:hypothetical protein|nr:hypothetical protein [bacterium]MDB0072681.1 hypothetical protein [bacterium]MDB4234949.1 hypothetical protein [bacterium]MDB4351846.1 hypothetical protein [Porticoccaceae bacterium]|tara:strand:- start:474 stop:824 length:351 start_codon:yes stop_codon:yes gene_type:complete